MSDLEQMAFPELTLSAEDSRARTSAAQESKLASRANALAYGQSSPELLAKYDRATQSWRTSQLSLVETKAGGLAEYSGTWPRSGMTRSGTAYRLAPLVRLTDATGCGLWPTPRANNAEKRGVVANEPRNGLPAAVRYWPTPCARDYRMGDKPESRRARMKALGVWHSPNLNDVVAPGGRLNPAWVEWLMGFPIGYTDLKDWETPSCRISRK